MLKTLRSGEQVEALQQDIEAKNLSYQKFMVRAGEPSHLTVLSAVLSAVFIRIRLPRKTSGPMR